MLNFKEPTSYECEHGLKVFEDKESIGYATHYPQMGGYISKCIVVLSKLKENGCFDVYVWHDGEFPLYDDNGDSPVHLHHCSFEQFINFGKFVSYLEKGKEGKEWV